MARPRKQGIDYFPFDVDFFEDDKVMLIDAEFGNKGVLVAIRLLCKIYKNGYYYQWGDDECLLLSKQMGAGFVPKLVGEIVTGLVRRSFFDKGVWDSFRVLTSVGIQRRYVEATRGRSIEEGSLQYWLLSGENEFSTEKPQFLTEKPSFSTEKVHKVNKRKEKEIKENNSLSLSPSFEADKVEINELLAQQREMIFSIFFFSNFVKPEQEVENFYTHYAANGWRRSGGIAIRTAEQLLACARQWKPKNDKPRFDENLLVRYHKFYDAVIRGGKWGQQQLSALLHGLVSLKWADLAQTRIDIRCSRELCELLAPHVEKVAEKMGKSILIFENK